jgi:(E)-4-hydroxy-3-methylbut-2-enyl-diphosphate synthase
VAGKADHKVSNEEMIEKIVERVEARAAALRAARDVKAAE